MREKTGWNGQWLDGLVLVSILAYLKAIIKGKEIVKKAKYLSRHKETSRKYERRSRFDLGLDSQDWLKNLNQYQKEMQKFINLAPQTHRFYRKGLKNAKLMWSIL